ncbi:barrier-to-autointegration factor isoform X2 [Scleropages formosus]|uniref:barrier-to-autointegration factor isoform X2 n=1 Tax=Scleropages formosus TaxID=113540 RepID=UPI000879182E|nr:uncharacterized protein LOC108920206 isoform X2 [Scleropages formosus]
MVCVSRDLDFAVTGLKLLEWQQDFFQRSESTEGLFSHVALLRIMGFFFFFKSKTSRGKSAERTNCSRAKKGGITSKEVQANGLFPYIFVFVCMCMHAQISFPLGTNRCSLITIPVAFADAVFVPKITAPLGNMTSTSKKHRDFVAEPLGHKSVFVLPGIGKVLGERLVEKGFDKACMILGQFLLLRKNQALFCEWLKSTCGANRKQQEDCYAALLEWCYSFL